MPRLAFVVLLCAVPSAALPAASLAQPEGANQVAAALAISTPRGEFDDNTDTGFGFTGTYVRSITPNRAVGIGLSASFLSYGSTSRQAPLSNTIPDITVNVETSNNTAFVLGVFEVRIPGKIQPYVQATGGGGFFYTTTSLENTLTDEVILSDTNQSDGTWVWGGGGGLRFRVWESTPDPQEAARESEEARTHSRAYIDVGARYLKGSEVEYLKEGSLVTDDGEFDIDPRLARSEIEVVQYQIGVTVTF
ncbi:MAG: outer membrane beta-barrel protein [Gemmatimonadota bacterium]